MEANPVTAHTRPREGSRIADLPFDVLVQIFALHRKPAVLLDLASVCHGWRAIIVNEHVLWTKFSLDCNTRAAQVLAQLALAGSACELSVTVHLDRHSHWAAMSVYLDTLLQQHARIRYLEFSDAMATAFRGNTRDDRFSCVGIVTSLGGKRHWPCLRTLVWQPNSFFDVGTDFRLDIIAPRLERLELDEVAVDGTFPSLCAGGALTNVRLRLYQAIPGLFQALSRCTNLTELALEYFRTPWHDLGTTGPAVKLQRVIRLKVHTVASRTGRPVDARDLLRILSCCPRLEDLSIAVDYFMHFHHSPQTHFPNLRNLRGLKISYGQRGGDNSALFELLRLTINEDFRELTLENISLSPALPLATEIRTLDLVRVLCSCGDLTVALSSCTKLQTLTLSNVTLTSGDSVQDVAVIDLPNLRTVSLDCETASTDLFLILLPVEGVQAVNMGTHTYLAYDWALPLLSVFDSGDIEITIAGSDLQRTTICVSQVKSRTSQSETWTRAFCAASFVETLNRLDEDMLLFSRLTCLTVDLALIDNAVAFLPSALPALLSLTVRRPATMHGDQHTRVARGFLYGAIARRDGSSIHCPALRHIILHIQHVRTENDKPKPIVLSDDIRNRFCAIFRSDVALVLETVHSFDGVTRM